MNRYIEKEANFAAFAPLLGFGLGSLYGGYQGLKAEKDRNIRPMSFMQGALAGGLIGGLGGMALPRLFFPAAMLYMAYKAGKSANLWPMLPPPLRMALDTAGDYARRGWHYFWKGTPYRSNTTSSTAQQIRQQQQRTQPQRTQITQQPQQRKTTQQPIQQGKINQKLPTNKVTAPTQNKPQQPIKKSNVMWWETEEVRAYDPVVNRLYVRYRR